MTARGSYRNPRHFNRPHQIILFTGQAYHHTVRDVQEKDGHTYGWIRHDRGDWVVRHEPSEMLPNKWCVMTGMSCTELERDWREVNKVSR